MHTIIAYKSTKNNSLISWPWYLRAWKMFNMTHLVSMLRLNKWLYNYKRNQMLIKLLKMYSYISCHLLLKSMIINARTQKLTLRSLFLGRCLASNWLPVNICLSRLTLKAGIQLASFKIRWTNNAARGKINPRLKWSPPNIRIGRQFCGLTSKIGI